MYACAWGPGSARVHDAFDLVFIRETGGEWADDEHILTTWHHDESLDEALWFAIFNASLPYAEIQSVLAVVSPPYAEHVERRLADSEQLDDDVV
jgi:hypothetical protein